MSDVSNGPRIAKGGIYAPADVDLIKRALASYGSNHTTSDAEVNQIANLLHRLNSRA